MYESLFNPDVFTISAVIYSLLALCVVLAIKLIKLEKENRKNVSIILDLNDKVAKLEEDEQ